jgi:hypothetical protein
MDSRIVNLNKSVNSSTIFRPIKAIGGVESVITDSGMTYKLHVFTTVGSDTFTVLDAGSDGMVEVLVVGGGGGGGMDMGGGGGGGGVIYTTYQVKPGEAVPVTVGQGGFGGPQGNGGYRTDGTGPQPGSHQFTISATNGGNSVFGSLVAIGGGYGGSSYFDYTPNLGIGSSGGSGGGTSGYSNGSVKAGQAGTAGQGHAGGQGGGQYYSGGGGGAAGVGVSSTARPDGGPGRLCSILGYDLYWGGGGGGSSYSLGTGGNGGIGGGGGGALGTTTGGAGYNNGQPGYGGSPNSQTNTRGGAGGANTGGGGGGGSHYNATNTGGEGGSGIVVVRYPLNRPLPIQPSPIQSGLTMNLDAGLSYSYASGKIGPIRYVRVYANGSTSNPSTHFVEIQANTSTGINRALNRGSGGGLSQYSGGTPEFTVNNTNWQILTNGSTDSSDYIGFGSGGAGIQMDLGQVFDDISEIRVWNYYADGRTYYNLTIFVSLDGTNWTTLYGPTNTATTASGVPARASSPTFWYDYSLSGRNGILVGAATYTSTNLGEINISSGSSYITLPSNQFNYGTGQFTIEAWVSPIGTQTTNNIIFASQSSNSAGFFGLGYNSTNGWFFTFFNGSTRPTTYITPVPSTNNWYHVVGTRDTSNNLRLYVNNVVATSPANSTLSVTSSDPRIGINPASGAENWSGKIGVFRTYNRQLNDSEIAQNFNAGRSRYGI